MPLPEPRVEDQPQAPIQLRRRSVEEGLALRIHAFNEGDLVNDAEHELLLDVLARIPRAADGAPVQSRRQGEEALAVRILAFESGELTNDAEHELLRDLTENVTSVAVTPEALLRAQPLFSIGEFQFYEHPQFGDEAPLIVLTPDNRLIVDSSTFDRETARDGVDQNWYAADRCSALEVVAAERPASGIKQAIRPRTVDGPGISL